MAVSESKIAEINRRLTKLGVREDDLREEFIKGSGAGGQKINKTNSCVQLTFLKKGWVVKCQKSRSREENRFFARRNILERLEQDILGEKSEREQKARRIRAQKKKRSKRTKEKILEAKKQRSEVKKLRQVPRGD